MVWHGSEMEGQRDEEAMKTDFGFILQLQWMARALIANEQGGPLAALRISPDQPAIQHTMAAVVVHTAATLFSRQSVELLHPLVAMLTKPAELTVSDRGVSTTRDTYTQCRASRS